MYPQYMLSRVDCNQGRTWLTTLVDMTKEPENGLELLSKGNMDLEEYIYGPQQNVNLNENKGEQGTEEEDKDEDDDDEDHEDESTDEAMDEDDSTYAPSDSSLVSI